MKQERKLLTDDQKNMFKIYCSTFTRRSEGFENLTNPAENWRSKKGRLFL